MQAPKSPSRQRRHPFGCDGRSVCRSRTQREVVRLMAVTMHIPLLRTSGMHLMRFVNWLPFCESNGCVQLCVNRSLLEQKNRSLMTNTFTVNGTQWCDAEHPDEIGWTGCAVLRCIKVQNTKGENLKAFLYSKNPGATSVHFALTLVNFTSDNHSIRKGHCVMAVRNMIRVVGDDQGPVIHSHQTTADGDSIYYLLQRLRMPQPSF